MDYVIKTLEAHRRDLVSAANELEVKATAMLGPEVEATIDRVRQYRLNGEQCARAIAVLNASNDINPEDRA